MNGNFQIRRGEQVCPTDAASMAYQAAERMRVPQIAGGAFNLSPLYQAADIRGTHGDTADFHFGDDVAAQAEFRAFFAQQFRGSLVFVAEVMIVSRHQMHCMISFHQDIRHKFIPGRRHHFPVKRHHQHIADAV